MVLALAMFSGCSEKIEPVQSHVPVTPAPAFQFASVGSTNDVASGTYRGYWVVLTVWASWSPNGVRQMSTLELLREKLASQGVRMVGISVDEVEKEEIRAFVNQLEVQFDVLHANLQEATDAFGQLDQIPSTFIIDRNWNIVNRYNGYVSYEHLLNEMRYRFQEEKAKQ